MGRYSPDKPTLLPGGKVMLSDGGEYGPCMKALMPRQRQFVLAYLAMGQTARGKEAQAYLEAGYAAKSSESASYGARRLLGDPKIQLAIQEEGRKALVSGGPLATDVVLEVMVDPTSSKRDRLSAAKLVMDRAGLHGTTEHKTTVTHELSEEQLLKGINAACARLGVSAEAMLGPELAKKYLPKPEPIDAEFEEVTYDPELEEMLA